LISDQAVDDLRRKASALELGQYRVADADLPIFQRSHESAGAGQLWTYPTPRRLKRRTAGASQRWSAPPTVSLLVEVKTADEAALRFAVLTGHQHHGLLRTELDCT